MRPCRQLVEQDLTDRVWKRVEHNRILLVIEYESLAGEVEQSLREAREVKEAVLAMMKEEEMVKKRLEKLEELRKLWKKKREEKEFQKMVEKLGDLRLCDFERDLNEIEAMVEALVMGVERYKPTLKMDDVEMEKDDNSLPGIRWEDEEMDTSIVKELPKDQSMEGVAEMDMMEEYTSNMVEAAMMRKTNPDEMEVVGDSNDNVKDDCEEESVVVEVSLWEEPHHHGGGLAPVQGPPTIPEKGVEEGPVFGLPTTGGQSLVHTPSLGPRKVSLTPEITSKSDRAGAHTPGLGAGLCTGVQSGSFSATDLRKVGSRSPGTNQEKSPSMVNGRLEMFCDIKSLICEWEHLEGDKEEWEAKEGWRRGGRRVSRRVSELLEKFEGGGGQRCEENRSEIEVNSRKSKIVNEKSKVQTLKPLKSNIEKDSTLSTTFSMFDSARFGNKITKNENNSTYSQVDTDRISNGLKSCDWPTVIVNQILSTNRKPALASQLKRKREAEQDFRDTKKRRRGSN